jgi:hypothetical protein
MTSTECKDYENTLKDPGDTLTPGSTLNSQLGHSVVNLSNVHLYKDQIAALEKGLTFCPSPGMPDITNIWNDLEDFFRRLRIKRYFDEFLEEGNLTGTYSGTRAHGLHQMAKMLLLTCSSKQ